MKATPAVFTDGAEGVCEMTDEQINQMVDRFLGWRLPENFSPDDGISFKPLFNEHLPTPCRHQPRGTDLFDAQQAEEMVRYMIDGLDPNEPKVGPVVPWPKDGKCPVNDIAYLRLTWSDPSITPVYKRAENCNWATRLPNDRFYQVLWSPDPKDYEMPKPKVEVRWRAVMWDMSSWTVSLPEHKHACPFYERGEFREGQLIGIPVVLTREEALKEVGNGD